MGNHKDISLAISSKVYTFSESQRAHAWLVFNATHTQRVDSLSLVQDQQVWSTLELGLEKLGRNHRSSAAQDVLWVLELAHLHHH